MDHDRLFKELLTTFFAEFIDLFLPNVAAELDRASIQFVDKEVFTDIGSGDRHEVDLLAKVRLVGREAFILIHVENQSTWQADFSQRMFRYFSLIHGKYALPVYPIAVYSFDRPLAVPTNRYEVELFDLPVLRFRFHAIQLNTLNWREFLTRPNPVASALMVKMRIEPADRPRVKLECLRMLATLRLDPARTRLIGVFMNSYLQLTSAEMKVYNLDMQKLETNEKEFAWEIENEWTQIGEAKGEAKGVVKGRVQLVTRLLGRRFGDVPMQLSNEIARLTDTQVEDLVEALFGFKSMDEARTWIARAEIV